METTIRLVEPENSEQIRNIYAPHVRESPVSFEVTPPTTDEMASRIESDHPEHPWLVCEDTGEILGYAYAGPHRTRDAYQWSVDSSVYVHEEHRQNGIARGLYSSLFEILRLQGFYNVYAGVALPNPASVGFHESMGFAPVGVYENAGYKNGAWHDVRWFQRSIAGYTSVPEPPRSLSAVRTDERWSDAVTNGLSSIA